MSRRLLLIIAIIAGVTVALGVWFLIVPDALPEPDAAAPEPPTLVQRQEPEMAGAASPPPEEPAWTPELDHRAGEILRQAGLGWRLACVPEQGFDPGQADTLFEDTFVLPPLALPDGRVRVEVQEPRGVLGLQDHGRTVGLMVWDVAANPPCLLRPAPTRRVVDRIPDHVQGMAAWACATSLDVGPGGTIDQEVQGSHEVHDRNGQLVCPFGVRLDGHVVLEGFVPMEGPGPARLVGVTNVEGPADEVPLGLEERLAELEERRTVMDTLYGRRIDGLKTLILADPVIAESVRDRLFRIEAEYERSREGFRSYLEGKLQEQE